MRHGHTQKTRLVTHTETLSGFFQSVQAHAAVNPPLQHRSLALCGTIITNIIKCRYKGQKRSLTWLRPAVTHYVLSASPVFAAACLIRCDIYGIFHTRPSIPSSPVLIVNDQRSCCEFSEVFVFLFLSWFCGDVMSLYLNLNYHNWGK